MKRLTNWFKGLSVIKRTVTIGAVTILSLAAIGAANQPPSPATTPDIAKTVNTITAEPQVKQAKVEIKNVSATEVVPFTSSTLNDASLPQGLSEIRTAGVAGVRTIVYKVTYTNDAETSHKEVSNSITTQPVNEVVAKGTKAPQPECPHGTYYNSQGNEVCRPHESSIVPAGATAKCRDDTYSFSQSHRGTCSHHDGVASWL